MKPTKKQSQKATAAPIIAKGQEKAVLEKLLRAAKTYDEAWALVHKTFARKTYGKVRDVIQKFSESKTLRAAFNSVHGKKGAKAELRRAA